MNTAAPTHGARVAPIPPPLFYVASFVLGVLLHAMTDDHIGGRPATAWLGALFLLAGLALAAGALAGFIRARTTVIPHRPVARLVTVGPYRLSRNPMYTGLALICVGGACAINSWWPIVTLAPALIAIRMLIIAPEETYLRTTFGPEYEKYCHTVRRWL